MSSEIRNGNSFVIGYLIYLILLFFNLRINGVYIITIISLLILSIKLLQTKKIKPFYILSFLLFLILLDLSIVSVFPFTEPIKYTINLCQIFIMYDYYAAVSEKKRLIKFVVITTVLYLICSFYEFRFGSFLWFESRNYDDYLPRVNLGFGDSNSLAGFLIIFSALLFKTKYKSLFLLVFLVGLITFSRAFIFSFVIILFFNLHFKKAMLVLAILLLIAIVLSPIFIENYQFAVDRILESNIKDDPRYSEWLFSLSKLNFWPDWKIFYHTLDPHNSFILALNLFGILGALFLFIFLFKILNYEKHCFKKNYLISLVLSFGVFCLFNSELFSVRNTASLGIILGLSSSLKNKLKFNI